MGLLKDYLMLLRIHTAGVTAAVLVMGALLGGCRNPPTLALIFLIGVLLHTAGFALNEVMDLPYDRRSPHLRHKPLVRGVIKRSSALHLSISLFALSLILFYLTAENLLALLILFASSSMGAAYNIWGKRFPFSDLLAAGWFALLPLSSATAFGGSPRELLLILPYIFLQILFNNSVEGGMKDLKSDRISGSRGTLISLGAEEGSLKGRALVYSLTVRTLLALSPLLPVLLTDHYSLGVILAILLSTTLLLFLSVKTIRKPPEDRKDLLKLFTLHEAGSFLLLFLLLLPLLPLSYILPLFVIPPLWNVIFTRIIYGGVAVPGV